MAKLTIFLPKDVKLFAAAGDEIPAGHLLATSSNSHVLCNIAPLAPQKKEGEHVIKGEVIAQQRNMFSLSKKTIKAPCSGKITRIDRQKGEIEIMPDEIEKADVISPVAGKVIKLSKDEISIDFKGTIVFAKRGAGGMKKGKLIVLSKEDDEVTLPEISLVHKDKVLLGGRMSRSIMEKAFGIGAASILATAIADRDFDYFENDWRFAMSLALLAKTDYRTLSQYVDKDVVVEAEHKRILIEN